MTSKVSPISHVSQEKQLWNAHKNKGFMTVIDYFINRLVMVTIFKSYKSGDAFAKGFWAHKDATPAPVSKKVVPETNIRTRAIDALRREDRLYNS